MKNNQRKFSNLSVGVFLSAWIFLCSSAQAQVGVRWWNPPEETKNALFAALDKKVGKTELPDYPANSILDWSLAQFPEPTQGLTGLAGQEYRQAVARAVYEHVLVADDILQKSQKLSDPAAVAQQHRRVMMLAEAAALRASVVLNDAPLVVLIREAYQLPYLKSASTEADHAISQEHIVEAISAAYETTKETDKEISALKTLISIASNRNTADSGRAKVAQAYARKGDYARAIAYLQAIRDPSISGAKNLIPKYEALQAKSNTSRKPQ